MVYYSCYNNTTGIQGNVAQKEKEEAVKNKNITLVKFYILRARTFSGTIPASTRSLSLAEESKLHVSAWERVK